MCIVATVLGSVRACSVTSVVSDSVTLWTIAHEAPLSVDSPGKKTGVGSVPSSRVLPDPGMEHASLTSPAVAGGFFVTSATWEVQI